VHLPDGAEWVEDFINELASFPHGRHDDQVDAFGQGVIYFRNREFGLGSSTTVGFDALAAAIESGVDLPMI
jgi:hypothetical protein